jgi:hypothetical protein
MNTEIKAFKIFTFLKVSFSQKFIIIIKIIVYGAVIHNVLILTTLDVRL